MFVLRNEFLKFQEPTIGAAFLTKRFTKNNNTFVFEIWDTAGQERYHSLAPMYYRGAAAAIIVYDITNVDSLNGAKSWIKELKLKNPTKCIIALVGNKMDLEEKRKVNGLDVKNYAMEQQCIHVETSAKTAHNVERLFEIIADKLPKKKKNAVNAPNILSQHSIKRRKQHHNCC